jgi:tetratricopeptide (TPR) repeat protein
LVLLAVEGKEDMFQRSYAGLITTTLITCALLSVFTGCQSRFGKGGSPVDLYVDAVTLHETGHPNQAVDKLDAAIKKQEDFSQAWSLKGDIYQQTKQYEKSAEAYQKATDLNAWSFHDFFNLGKVYQLMQKFAQAVGAYARACELRPDNLQAHINIAECSNKIQQYDQALQYAQHAQQIDPNAPGLQQILGDAYEGKEDYEQAITAFKRALEVDANNTDVMTSLALAYLRTNRDQPAMLLLASAVKLDPQNGKASRYLGYTYLRLYEKNASEYRDLLQKGTADQNQLDSMVSRSDKLVEKAVDSYTRAIEIDPNDWDAHRGLGVAFIIKGRKPDGSVDDLLKAKAIEQWRTSLQINPDQPRADRLRNLIAKYRSQ